MTTTDFIARHTEAGGTILRTSEENDRACIFLTPQGCGVHGDRPLVLPASTRWGAGSTAEGRERFGHMAPHPQTAGIYGTGATVADYLEQQGLAPFFDMSDRYEALYWRMLDVLERLDADELARRAERREAIDETEPGVAVSAWTDIDRTVAEFCQARGRTVPQDIDGLVAVHIEAVEAWLAAL